MHTQKPPNAFPPTNDEVLDQPNREIPPPKKNNHIKADTVCTEQQSQGIEMDEMKIRKGFSLYK
jgi:hypothetical protein